MNTQKLPIYIILILTIAFYCLDYFFRISPSLVLEQLMVQYHSGPLGMGVFASAFYLGYVLFQIPSGIILDRYRFKLPMALIIFICTFSFITFIFSTHVFVGVILRFIIGLTSGMSFVGVLYIARMYLDPKWLPFISGVTVAVGTLSASFIQTVNAFLQGYFPWQETLLSFSMWGIIVALVLIFVPLKPSKHNIQLPEHDFRDMFIALWGLLKNRRFVLNGVIGGLFYAPTSIITAVWGVVFFKTAYQLSTTDASSVIFMIFLGWAVGSPIIGLLGSHMVRNRAMTVLPAILGALTITAILYHPDIIGDAVYFMAFLFGLFSSAQVLVWKTFDAICPPAHTGLGVALTNMLIMIVVTVLHPIIGACINNNYNDSPALKVEHMLDGLGLVPLMFIAVALLGLFQIRRSKHG